MYVVLSWYSSSKVWFIWYEETPLKNQAIIFTIGHMRCHFAPLCWLAFVRILANSADLSKQYAVLLFVLLVVFSPKGAALWKEHCGCIFYLKEVCRLCILGRLCRYYAMYKWIEGGGVSKMAPSSLKAIFDISVVLSLLHLSLQYVLAI